MKLAIVGSRKFNDYDRLETTILNNYELSDITFILSGGAIGADDLAIQFAKNHKIPYLIYYLQWSTYGKQAGYIRNTLIVNACDSLIAFWDGESKGTKHSISLAKKENKNLIVDYYNDKTLFDNG